MIPEAVFAIIAALVIGLVLAEIARTAYDFVWSYVFFGHILFLVHLHTKAK